MEAELEGVNHEEITYEGYGIMASVLIETMTDNRNRTVDYVIGSSKTGQLWRSWFGRGCSTKKA